MKVNARGPRASARSRVIPIQPATVPNEWTTPALLRLGIYGVALASLFLMITAILGARSYQEQLTLLGQDAAPEGFHAQRIQTVLAAMDANTARQFLQRSERESLHADFEKERAEASDGIIAAAQNAHFRATEASPVRTLATGLSEYVVRVQQARDYQNAGDKRSLVVLQAAMRQMDTELLPAVRQLELVNRALLEDLSRPERRHSVALLLLNMSWLMVGGVLLCMQLFLARRVRRFLNPLLLCATAVVFIYGAFGALSFTDGNRYRERAENNAIKLVNTTWHARSLAYQIDSEEGRALLGFSPTGKSGSDIDQLLRDWNSTVKDRPNADSFSRAAEHLHRLEASGQHLAAVALYESDAPGDFQSSLKSLDDDLGHSTQAAQTDFEEDIRQGFQAVHGFEISAPLVALIIVACGAMGILPRLREYTR